jgi:hypothetical protein
MAASSAMSTPVNRAMAVVAASAAARALLAMIAG